MVASWVITLPMHVDWNEYMRDEVEPAQCDPGLMLNFRVSNPPRAMATGDRCYIVWRGRVRGWMTIAGVKHWPEGFHCLATREEWAPGKYIQRGGIFHAVSGPSMRGFQGVRKFTPMKEAAPIAPGPLYLPTQDGLYI
jgi:hypothetical protein